MKLSTAADWHGKVNRVLASAAGAKVTCCSLIYSVSIHKSVTVYTKDQKAIRQSHMASKLDLIAVFAAMSFGKMDSESIFQCKERLLWSLVTAGEYNLSAVSVQT